MSAAHYDYGRIVGISEPRPADSGPAAGRHLAEFRCSVLDYRMWPRSKARFSFDIVLAGASEERDSSDEGSEANEDHQGERDRGEARRTASRRASRDTLAIQQCHGPATIRLVASTR